MKSPYRYIMVYDLETGGFHSQFNSITEAAFVVIDLENLEIVDELSVMMLPYLDLSNRNADDPIAEAKEIYKQISEKDEETGKKVLNYKGEKLNLRNLDNLVNDIEDFESEILMSLTSEIIDWPELKPLLESAKYGDITKLFFDKTYTKGAFEATHMNKELLLKEGITREAAAIKVEAFFKRYTVGNSKPILAGHNIEKFDNPFLLNFFIQHGIKWDSIINQTMMIDTLSWARLRFFEAPNFQLGTVANELGVTLKQAHRALPDTIANAKVVQKMFQSFRGEGTQQSSYVRRKLLMEF